MTSQPGRNDIVGSFWSRLDKHVGQIRGPSGLLGTSCDCPLGGSWGRSQVTCGCYFHLSAGEPSRTASRTSCHRPPSSVRSGTNVGPRVLVPSASQPQQGQRPPERCVCSRPPWSAASQNRSCSSAQGQRQAGRRDQPGTSSTGLGGAAWPPRAPNPACRCFLLVRASCNLGSHQRDTGHMPLRPAEASEGLWSTWTPACFP